MKIFFNSSIAGKSVHLDIYLSIIKLLKKNGHTVFSNHVIKDECDNSDLKLRKDYIEYVNLIKNNLHQSDVVIVESTFPSIMVGYLIHLAISQHKPVLILYQNNPHRILVGESKKNIILKKYSEDEIYALEKILINFIKRIENQSLNIRFNLMLDANIDKVLGDRSRRGGISKADYIRGLIEKDINS